MESRQNISNPDALKMRALFLAFLGNVYLGAVLALTLLVFAVLLASVTVLKALAVKLTFVVGAFLWMMVKALWVKIPPPEGWEVTKDQAPDLFACIGELAKDIGAPPFHHVLITPELNAGVVQTPRLGIFGWYRNDLLIGLPLLQALTPVQFRAVLAHELGHLAKGHGRTSNWIYRQRLRWARLLHIFSERESRGLILFKPFLSWYAPYFNAVTFPLARAGEYEADAAAARLTSPDDAAQALTGVSVTGSYLAHRYWPEIHKMADDLPEPSCTPYLGMGPGFFKGMTGDSVRDWVEQAMGEKTTDEDTHPALKDRLSAMGASPSFAPPGPGMAADVLLGDAREAIAAEFDRRWREGIAPAWENHFSEMQEARQHLGQLNARHDRGEELSLYDAYERAKLTGSVGGNPENALAQFRELHARAPEDPVICFGLGASLMEKGDAEGCSLMERAMVLDDDAAMKGLELLWEFHSRSGDTEKARVLLDRLVERSDMESFDVNERNQVTLKDVFAPHGLPEDEAVGLEKQLSDVSGLRRAYLVRKNTRYFTHRPLYILGYTVTGPFRFHSEKKAARVLQAIRENVSFPGETIIVNVEGKNSRFERKFKRIKGSRLVRTSRQKS